MHWCLKCRLTTHRSTEQNRLIFSDPNSRVTPDEIKAEEISNLPSGSNTDRDSLKASDKSQRNSPTLRWSQSSQKRDSYVAAISTSQLNLDDLSSKRGKSLTMEEILLQDRGKDRARSLNGNEMSNKVRNFANQLNTTNFSADR